MNLLPPLFATMLTLTLGGCGGGSSSAPTTSPPPPFTAEQGIWSSPAGAADNMSAIVLIDGKIWALAGNNSTSQLLRGEFDAPGGLLKGSGRNYTLGTIPTVHENISLAASVIQKTSLNVTVTASTPVAYNLAYQSRYDTAAALTDFAAIAWKTPLPSNVVLTWLIDSSGKIAGTSSTGCSYDGQLSLRAEAKAVVDAAVTQTCLGKAVVADQIRNFNGVAVRTAGSTAGMVMMLTTADDTEDLAVILSQ